MNKILIIKFLSIILFSTATIAAQQSMPSSSFSDTRENFKIGFKAGVNLSNVYDEEGEDFVADGKAGFVGGAFLSVPFGKYIGFQPEVLYSDKGYQSKGSILGIDYDYKRTLTYLDIPLQLQIKPAPYVSILVGPQYSYLLKVKDEFNDSSNTTDAEDINSDNYKKNIFGFALGADFNVESFMISIRGSWDVTKSDIEGDDTDPRYKNQVLQFTLGYAF